MDPGITGKSALVFGAGGGPGDAIAQTLAAEGARVLVPHIDAAAITGAGGHAVALQWNIGDLSVLVARLDFVTQTYGGVDILANNTGGPPLTPVQGTLSRYFDSMVRSVISVTNAVLPGMKARGWGRIITSTSSGVVAPIANLCLSNTLRLALVGWSKTLSREVGADGITANIVLPGRIATGRIPFLDEQKAKREGRAIADVTAESTASIPVGRYGKPQACGDAVAFLASARASYICASTAA